MTSDSLLRFHARSRRALRASCHLLLLAAMALPAFSCGRSGLEPGELELSSGGASGGVPSSGGFTTSGGVRNETGGAPSGGSPATGGATTGGVTTGGVTTGGSPATGGVTTGGVSATGGSLVKPGNGCLPNPEVCNGQDDDCNGRTDEVPPLPCPGGGFSYCVGGRQSACPKRCEACVPGSERICFVSFCTFWGVQTCTADGRSFGACREEKVPRECEGVGSAKNLAALERCCLDHGYCCADSEDLDQDGNRSEMLGACGDVQCQ